MTERRASRSRRPPALASRLFVSTAAAAATIALVGWIDRASANEPMSPTAVIVRRVVVVAPQPEPVPYITLEAVLPGRTVTVITQPPRVVHRAPAASSAAAPPPVVTTSSGS